MKYAFAGIRAAALCIALANPPASAQPPPSREPYPGTITLHVDATDLDRKVFRIKQTIPARPGPLTLYLPRWIPGHHSPTGDASLLAGLKISARGQSVPWVRDVNDTHAFNLEVPAGAAAIDLEFQHLSPVAESSGRVVLTPAMANLQWNNLLLYPAGHEARAITFQASMTLPSGWKYGTALRSDRETTGTVQFKPVSLDTLVDSPVFAGRHMKRFDLDAAGAARPVVLHLMADREEQLKASDAQIEAHRELVRQADKLFGARHFAKYDFLLALTDELGRIGLEHHESSENGVRPNYFKDWDKSVRSRELLPHEYVHSWNGKFRRPRDLWTPHFNLPMRNSLLWLYEGMTEYWGRVLAARSGLVSAELARDELAQLAASYSQRDAGRTWRNLQDTTNDAIMSARRWSKDWRSWQRSSGDYYGEAVLIWLDADTLIREKSGGRKSLDDFARAFFGVPGGARDDAKDGEPRLLTYTFDDVVATLNAVQPHDWARFLRERLDSHASAAPLDGLARGGWKLAFTDTPSDNFKTEEADGKFVDFSYSLGLQVGEGGRLSNVLWEGPAFKAGVPPAATLVAVNMRAYSAEVLKDAVAAGTRSGASVELLLREGDRFRSVRIDHRGGLRYPKLERAAGDDRLGAILAPR
jgi:predicted metalloprotease with PDZ domain